MRNNARTETTGLTYAEWEALAEASGYAVGGYNMVHDLVPTVAHIKAEAIRQERERIARSIQAAKPFHPTRNYTAVDAAYDDAARIARDGGVA